MTDPKLSLKLLTPSTAGPDAKTLLEEAEKQLGFVPNLYAYMANMPGLLATYSSGYQQFRAGAGFTPVEQETVFLSISAVNECHYCLAAHSMIADKVHGMSAELINALRTKTDLPDAKLNALATFTRIMVHARGRASQDELAAFFKAGYSANDVLGVILGVSVKTLSNYVNILSNTPVDAAFAEYGTMA